MIDCLESYQGQVKEAIEEFHQGTRAFYRANEEYVPYWQGESREAYELVYRDFCGNRGTYLCNCRWTSSWNQQGNRPNSKKDRGAIITMIRINPEELETVAKHVPDAEDACCRARTSLSWKLPSLVIEITGIGSDDLWAQRRADSLAPLL